MQTERSNQQYRHLSAQARAALMMMHGDGHSLRRIAERLRRAPSTLNRELLDVDATRVFVEFALGP